MPVGTAVPSATATPQPTTSVTPSPTPLALTGDLTPILVKFKSGRSTSEVAAAVQNTGGRRVRTLNQIHTEIVLVSAETRSQFIDAYRSHPLVERVAPAVVLRKAAVPNDPGYAQQWALPKIGWDLAYGVVSIGGTATIAVLDTGVDAGHPDLSGLMVGGQSFTGGNPNSDPDGHGTGTAGIAAAAVNNGSGLAGVAYSGARISSVQVLQPGGIGYDTDVVAGVLWAADNGASVILMPFSSPDYSAALADALAYASNKGVVLVAATGNAGSSAPSYPAGMPNVIGVAATDQNDHLAANSNTGSAAVGAPGVGMYTTSPGGGYSTMSGTSAAAADVAGLAAMLRANGKSGSFTSNQIRAATAPVSGQRFGRIDVAKALGVPLPPLATSTPGATPTPGASPTYVAGANTGTLSLSASTLSFGNTIVNTTSTSQGLTLTNTDKNHTVGNVSIAISGDYGQTNNCPATLAGNGTCTITVTFQPTTTGSRPGSVTVTSNAANGTVSTTLSGTGVIGPPTKLVFTAQPGGAASMAALTPQPVVKLEDVASNVVPDSSHTATLSLTTPGSATLAGTSTLTFSNGVAAFTNLSVDKAGGYTLTASTNAGSFTAASSAFTITPGATANLLVTAGTSQTAGTAFDVTLTARDQAGNTTPAYTGTVRFSSSDSQASLPPDYTFQAGDLGVHSANVTINIGGTQSVTVTDISSSSITGSQTDIAVTGYLSLGTIPSFSFNGALAGSRLLLAAHEDNLQVVDTTGSGSGWNLTVSAEPFVTGGSTSHSLPASPLAVGHDNGGLFSGPSVISGTGPITNPVSLTSPLTVPQSPATAAKFFGAASGSGSGSFNLSVPYSLSVPAGAFAGTYTSNVVVSLVAGP